MLAAEAEQAQHVLADMKQEQLDAIVEAIAKAFSAAAPELAELAVRETGFGNVTDKITKNDDGTYTQFHFVLSADLDMEGWTLPPIGTREYPFIGTFYSSYSSFYPSNEIVFRGYSIAL